MILFTLPQDVVFERIADWLSCGYTLRGKQEIPHRRTNLYSTALKKDDYKMKQRDINPLQRHIATIYSVPCLCMTKKQFNSNRTCNQVLGVVHLFFGLSM